ncbi:MAG: histidine phosphatase family protein, partial [Clostridia bacterium]|nr:histidine phosphatase family protein [Clostridia bacterium]
NRLSKTGDELVKIVAERYKNVQFDVIFASPLMRTMQTANIMNSYHNVKIIKDERLIEIGQGIFTGRLKSTLTDVEKQQRANRDESCGMEKFESVYARANDFLEFLKTQRYDNVLIITHNANASLLEDIINGVQVEFDNYGNKVKFKNAEVKIFTI